MFIVSAGDNSTPLRGAEWDRIPESTLNSAPLNGAGSL